MPGQVRSTEHRSAHVLVVGAGPAGCTAALRMAALGHRVTLIERGGPGRPAAVESAPASLRPLLASLGLQQAVDAAGCCRSSGAWVQWAGSPQRAGEVQSGGLIDRQRFDALLREAACAAGVRLLGAHARAARRAPEGGFELPLHDGRLLRADGIVWATGRSGDAAPGERCGAALVGRWSGDGQPLGHDSRVQAGPEGWAWAAPQPDGGCTAALFVDAQRLGGLDAAARERLYRDSLAGYGLIASMLRGHLARPLRVADTTPRRAAGTVEPRCVRAGEAAFSLDPLSSQGVAAAMRSGVQAAACLHTMLGRPADTALAQAFLQEQVEREWQRHRRWRAGYDAEAARHFGTPFWAQRAKDAASRELPAPSVSPADPLPALDLPIRLDGRSRFQPAPMLEGDWIVAAPALQHPGLPGPVGYVQGQPVADLLAALAPGSSVARVLQAWAARLGAQGAAGLLQSWWRLGVVVADTAPPLQPR
ncbi:NAD(P)/FAD-dependent oxidoreductase [Aquabacterium sp.]|uniref:flavin-dependent monooxygenase QhpG n=1 Tax=Aquabacterium sp. TaxID=1872578 RepID=UPI003783978E